MNNSKKLTAALIFPIACLVMLAGFKAYKVSAGKKIILPVTGYDPRDLIAGHYLIYRVEYNAPDICSKDSRSYDKKFGDKKFYMCVNKTKDGKIVSSSFDTIEDALDAGCDAVIKGECSYGRFIAGIEKFYIPDNFSRDLDKKIRDGSGKIEVSVDSSGKAVVKDLLINGIPLRQYLKDK